MKKYLFVFGFETPQQKIANCTHGYDDEDSAAVFIQAKNEEDALNWGKEIIKEAMKFLYKDNTLNWNPDDYAYWIEKGEILKRGRSFLKMWT